MARYKQAKGSLKESAAGAEAAEAAAKERLEELAASGQRLEELTARLEKADGALEEAQGFGEVVV